MVLPFLRPIEVTAHGHMKRLFPYSAWLPHHPIYHAWIIVLIAAIVEMVGSGLRAASGVFVDPLVVAHGWPNSAIALAHIVRAHFAVGRPDSAVSRRTLRIEPRHRFLTGMIGAGSVSSIRPSAAFSPVGAVSILGLAWTKRVLIPDCDRDPENMRLIHELP